MKVSVAMITYNHERFIAQAIESVLMQETSFDYELVIGEDCSTDRTREIVVRFQQQFPSKIRLLLPESNIGAHNNLAQTLAACAGEYIALLEGDDYWISPHKLQRQADFLNSHPDCSMCFHPVRWFYEDPEHNEGGVPPHDSTWPPDFREYSTIEDLLKEMFIQTASVMFRNGLLDGFPEWLHALPRPDWALYVLIARRGRIGCLNTAMSAYRKHTGGLTAGLDEERMYQDAVEMYVCVNEHLKFEYSHLIRPILADYYFKLAVLYDQRGDANNARESIRKSLAAQIFGKQKPSLNSIKMLTRLTFPSAYHFSKKLIRA